MRGFWEWGISARVPKPVSASPSPRAAASAPVAPAASSAEPQINDDPPPGAEILDDAALTGILNRFYPGGEVAEEPQPPDPPGATPSASADGTVGDPATDPQSAAAEPEPTDPAEPVAITFTPEQQAEIERRITEAKGEIEPVQTELEAERARAEALQEKLQGMTNPAPVPRDINPLLLTDDLAEIEQRQRVIDGFLAWADEHQGGYEAQKEGEESWTAEQIRKTQRALEREDAKVLPVARALIQERAQHRARARTTYPEMFNPKSEDYRIRQAFMGRAPWLKAVFPQIELWLGDMIAGERARQARAKAAGAVKPTPAKPLPKPVTPSPGGGAPSGGPKPPKRSVNEIDSNEFVKRGATRAALVDLIKESA